MTSRPFASLTVRVHVVSWLISLIARIGFSSDRSRITVLASTIRRTRSVMPIFMKVVHSLMFESPTITCSRRYRSASACGSSRVLMIGRLTGGGAGDPLPDVLRALGDAVLRAARAVQHLARTAPDLPRHEERDQDVGHPRELALPRDQIVLVAPVGVAGAVGVVLEQVDVAGDALLVQPQFGGGQEVLQDALARLVVGHHLARRRHTRAWRTRGASPHRGTAAHRSPGRRSRIGPSARPVGTGTGRPRRATDAAAHGRCR